MTLTPTAKKIIRDVLDGAIQDLSNNSCNDAPVRVSDVDREELLQFIDDYIEAMGMDGEEAEEYKQDLIEQADAYKGKVYFLDYVILHVLANKVLS